MEVKITVKAIKYTERIVDITEEDMEIIKGGELPFELEDEICEDLEFAEMEWDINAYDKDGNSIIEYL